MSPDDVRISPTVRESPTNGLVAVSEHVRNFPRKDIAGPIADVPAGELESICSHTSHAREVRTRAFESRVSNEFDGFAGVVGALAVRVGKTRDPVPGNLLEVGLALSDFAPLRVGVEHRKRGVRPAVRSNIDKSAAAEHGNFVRRDRAVL